MLLFIDNIFRFSQAGSEVSTLLGRMPSAVGYQPTLAAEMGDLQERITSTNKGSITSVQAIYVPADDLTDPAPAASFAHLDAIGARHLLIGPGKANMPFVDLKTNERWTLRANDGVLPWWIFRANRRVPGTSPLSYLSLLSLLRASPDATVGDVMKCEGPLYDRLIAPFLLAGLNAPLPDLSSLSRHISRTSASSAGGAPDRKSVV